jgi:hypothetical protein
VPGEFRCLRRRGCGATVTDRDKPRTTAVLFYGHVLDRESKGVPPDFPEQAERMLLAAAGFTQVVTSGEDYWPRRNQAADEAGVLVIVTGSREYPVFALAACAVIAYQHCGAVYANEPLLAGEAEQARRDRDLAAAVRLLGIATDHPNPGWRLSSFTGAHGDPWQPYDYLTHGFPAAAAAPATPGTGPAGGKPE